MDKSEKLEECGVTESYLATPEEVAEAVRQLTELDYARLNAAAKIVMGGTDFNAPEELVKEVLTKTFLSANGEGGRRWKRNVPFMAFLHMTFKGMCSDQRKSVTKKRTALVADLAGDSDGEPFDLIGQSLPAIDEELIEASDLEQRNDRASALLAKVNDFFKDDDQVQMIIMGAEDDLAAAEIRAISGMSQKEYDTAKKRLRRGLKKVSPKGTGS